MFSPNAEILLWVIGVVGVLIFIGWINHLGKKRFLQLQAKHQAKLAKQPYSHYVVTNIELIYNKTRSYFNTIDMTPIIFNDLINGDFQETQYGLVRDTGIDVFPTKTSALTAFKPASHLAFFAMTVDRNDRVDVESLELPDRSVNAQVTIGYNAFKEKRTPSVNELVEMYK